MNKITLIVPVYNEEKRIGSGDYFKEIAKINNVHFIFVNDGSTDGTILKLRKIATSIGADLLENEKNLGKAEAIRKGLLYAIKERSSIFVGILDCDGAFPINVVSDFLEVASEKFLSNDLIQAVIASRVKLSGRKIIRKRSRHYLSRLVITFIGLAVPEIPYDSQSGLKLFRISKELTQVISFPFETRWFFDLEVLLRANWMNRNLVWEEPIAEWLDVAGSHVSSKTYPRLIREIATMIRLGRDSRRNISGSPFPNSRTT